MGEVRGVRGGGTWGVGVLGGGGGTWGGGVVGGGCTCVELWEGGTLRGEAV